MLKLFKSLLKLGIDMMICFCIMLVFIKKFENRSLLFDLARTSKVTSDQLDVVTREMLDDLGLADDHNLLMMFKNL